MENVRRGDCKGVDVKRVRYKRTKERKHLNKSVIATRGGGGFTKNAHPDSSPGQKRRALSAQPRGCCAGGQVSLGGNSFKVYNCCLSKVTQSAVG